MIRSWADKKTKAFFEKGRTPKGAGWSSLERIVARKLLALASADRLEDLRSPPGNRLEALSGDRNGQYSIRVNDQWRVCFTWSDGGADDVEVTDYH